jgi:predicted secreted protein
MQPVATAIGTSATTLYAPFIDSTKERGTLIFLNLANTTTSDVTVDIFITTTPNTYIASSLLVPAKGNVVLSGAWTVNSTASLIKAIASATGVDASGTVVESDA